MFRSNTFGFILIVGLALAALVFIMNAQGGSSFAMPAMSDGRVVEKVGGKTVKLRPSDLQPGDKILAINGIPVGSAAEVFKVLEALYQPGLESLQVQVKRTDDDGKSEERTVELARDRIATLRLKGGKPNVQTYKATPTALYNAAQAGNAVAVEQILDSGGKSFVNDLVKDQTPLFAAVSKGNTEAVRVLLDYKADPNKAAADQTTPLMRAAELGNRDLVAALMVAGADTSLRNSQLQTASDIAADQGYLDVSDFIDNPSPTRFLTADQRRKIAEPLANMGVLKSRATRPSDAELSDAIRSYQRQAGLPVSGIVTSESYEDLVKFSIKAIGSKNEQAMSEATKKTLSRIFARALTEEWTPVNSTNGYPRCEEESVAFEISADQQTITWKSYRPGVTADDLAAGVKPTQEANFKVKWADQLEGYDSILVQPDPKPINGPGFQLWEIRDGSMKISQKARADMEPPAASAGFGDSGSDDEGEGPGVGASSDVGSGRASFLSICRT